MNGMMRSMCVLALILTTSLIAYGATRPDAPRPSVDEARERARLIHGTIDDTLQIVHARYYREDEGLPLPAATMKVVFQGLSDRHKIRLRWLVVDAKPMNTDHKPRDEFEKEAAKAIESGKPEYEQVADGTYRHVGVIELGSECLKCHLPGRTSNKSRSAGLVIEMPIATK